MNTIQWKILIVDDDEPHRKLISSILKDYQVIESNGTDTLQVVKKAQPDLILLDIHMPGINGLDICKTIQNGPHCKTPIIFITSVGSEEGECQGFEAGAVDYITKPIKPLCLLARVKVHLEHAHHQRILEKTVASRTAELQNTIYIAMAMLAKAGHYKDDDTGNHIWRMARYARIIAEGYGMDKAACNMLQLAAPMHDTGKIGTPDEILKKPGKLTSEEWVIMRQHPIIGYNILSETKIPFLVMANIPTSALFVMAGNIAKYHHEKWDGTGYPDGLIGNATPIEAQIVAIADVFDALTTERPYKKAWPVEKAVDEIRHSAGTHFNPKIVDVFLRVLPQIKAVKAQFN